MTNKEIIQKVNQAYINGDVEGVVEHCIENFKWNMIGTPALIGKDAMRNAIELMLVDGLPAIAIKKVIAEGDIVMSEGTITMTKKTGGQHFAAYCDVYQFENGKIQELSTYVVDLEPTESIH